MKLKGPFPPKPVCDSVIWLAQQWYQLQRATRGNYWLVHHTANALQAAQGWAGTQLQLRRLLASLFFPKVPSPSHSRLPLQPHGFRAPGRVITSVPYGIGSHVSSGDGRQAFFCQPPQSSINTTKPILSLHIIFALQNPSTHTHNSP